MQRSGLYYVVEFDIKGFFDNVDHSKLIKQLWSLNIRDKELLYVIRRILKAPILMRMAIQNTQQRERRRAALFPHCWQMWF